MNGKFSSILVVFVLIGAALFMFGCTLPNGPVCGNNICESPLERSSTCPADCGTSYATLQVYVFDSTGAAITNAQVSIDSYISGLTKIIPVDGSGMVVEQLPPGDYSISASASGYDTSKQNVTLLAGQTPVLKFSLIASTIPAPKVFTEILDVLSSSVLYAEHSVTSTVTPVYSINLNFNKDQNVAYVAAPGDKLPISFSDPNGVIYVDYYTNKSNICNSTFQGKFTVTNSSVSGKKLSESFKSAAPFSLKSKLTTIVPDQNVYVSSISQDLASGLYSANIIIGSKNYVVNMGGNTSFVVNNGTTGYITLTDVVVPACGYNVSAALKYASGSSSWMALVTPPYLDLKNAFFDQASYESLLAGNSITVPGDGAYLGKDLTLQLVDLLQTGSGAKPYQTKWGLSDSGAVIKYIQATPPFDLKDEFGSSYFTTSVKVIDAGMLASSSNYFALISK